MYEEGLLEIAGPIYDTNDDTNEGLNFPYLLQDPNDIAALFMTLDHTISNIDDPFPPFRYDVEEELCVRCIPYSPSYPQYYEHTIITPPM